MSVYPSDPPPGGRAGLVPQPNLNPFVEARAQRLINAVLTSIDNWRQRAEDIADNAHPVTGNKARALSLARDLLQAELSLRRLIGKSAED